MDEPTAENLVAEILLHVAHAKGSYPGGIPEEELAEGFRRAEQENVRPVPTASEAQKVLFLVEAETLSEDLLEFLRAMIERGMQRPFESVDIVPVPTGAALPELTSGISGILFGTSLAALLKNSAQPEPGSFISHAGGTFLCASSVAEIRASGATKKMFWQHLQSFLQRIQ